MTEQTSALIDGFADDLKRTPEYTDYKMKRELLRWYPERWKMANNYRRERFFLQESVGGDELFERMDEFERNNSHIHRDRLIEDYLNAELAVCRLLQDMHVRVFAAIDIDVEL